MDYDEYTKTAQRVAELVDKEKNYPAAVELLQGLIDSDLPDVDRAMMSMNMAMVCDLMGHEDHALQWYDHAIALERPYHRFSAATHKAAYHFRKGRPAEARAIYESLVDEPSMTLGERVAIQNQISQLSKPAG